MKNRNWRKGVLGILLAGAVGGAFPAATAVAGDEDIATRIVEYYRRKQNLPPDVNAQIKDIRDSQIPGARVATIELSRGAQKQDVGVVMSADGRYVVFGEVEDVTTDPFAEIAKKITTAGQPIRGGKNAPVTIVEFSDFQCPYCARAHETVSGQVMKQYGDKVKLVYKNYPLPFHKWAEAAAIAGECVFDQKEEAFWTLYDYLFEHQRDITPENLQEKVLEALKETKINTSALRQCMEEKKTLARVQADMDEGQKAGVTGTPAFLINGRKISGAQPFENFKAVIDDELKRAGKES